MLPELVSDQIRLHTFANGDSEAASVPADHKRTYEHLTASTRNLQTILYQIDHTTFLIHLLTSLATT